MTISIQGTYKIWINSLKEFLRYRAEEKTRGPDGPEALT